MTDSDEEIIDRFLEIFTQKSNDQIGNQNFGDNSFLLNEIQNLTRDISEYPPIYIEHFVNVNHNFNVLRKNEIFTRNQNLLLRFYQKIYYFEKLVQSSILELFIVFRKDFCFLIELKNSLPLMNLMTKSL
jgi:hypothetical protein